MMDIYNGDTEDLTLTASTMTPKPSRVKTIRLYRRNGYFGFGLRGGREHNIGFFVSTVIPASESELGGLSVGDQVIRIDGLPVAEALHKEMLNFIRSKTQITLTVKSGNLVPFLGCTNQALSKASNRSTKSGSRGGHPVLSASSSWSSSSNNNNDGMMTSASSFVPSFASLTLRADTKGRFGCSICEGPPHRKGVYIKSTDEGSVARAVGIKAGDRILQCNGFDVTTMDFDEAVDLLKDSTVLNLIISRGAGSDFISPGESSGYNSAASSINGDQSPMQNGKQKRLSIVREEIMDVIDERRGLVVGSVTVDCRKSWNYIEDDEWTDHHHSPLPPAETINTNVKMSSITHHHNVNSEQQDEERKLLQEERRRIQEAQRQLMEEKEKLERDRKQLEETRLVLMTGTALPTLRSSAAATPLSSQVETEAAKIINSNGPVHQQQHEQLMEEFKQKIEGLKSTDVTRKQVLQIANKNKIPTVHPLEANKSHRSSPSPPHQHLALKTTHSAPPPPPPLPSSGGKLPVARKKQAPAPPPPQATTQPEYSLKKTMDEINEKGHADGETIFRNKLRNNTPPVRVSIGTYHSQQEPSKMDFLPPKASRSSVGVLPSESSNATKSLLQAELSQTLSRARLRQRQSIEETTVNESLPKPQPSTTSAGSSIIHHHHSSTSPSTTIILEPKSRSSIDTSSVSNLKKSTEAPMVLSTFGRQPSVEIQAKMASLAAAAAASAGGPHNSGAISARSTSPTVAVNNNDDSLPKETISMSPDNKVTIKVNPYVSSSINNRAPASRDGTNPHNKGSNNGTVTFGQTTYIDLLPITEL